MTDSIAEAAVALSLMLEALGLLDAPEHGVVAAHLRSAIDELSPVGRGEPSPSRAAADCGTPKA